MTTVAEHIVAALARQGVRTVWGVVGDALNPVTDAIRRTDELEWIGVRHEEAGAFAASAQAQLTGQLGVCMGTVGPGSIHLLNGLYDAKKSHAPVLALCGQVPLAELGSDFFQEVNNDVVFGSVNANRRHYELAAKALGDADKDWLDRLISRRVPLSNWQEALEKRPGDIKVVIDFTL